MKQPAEDASPLPARPRARRAARERVISPAALLGVVGALMTMSALATDVMLPAFPTMARDFGVGEATIQQVISIFMIGYALPQLIIGSLADRFGRRSVLLGGLFVYFLGSVLCLVAPSLGWLLFGRFVQGLGAASGPILSRAVLRDLYRGAELGRMLSYAMIIFAAAPLLAPSIGALMLRLGHWEMIFVFLLVVAVVLVALVLLVLPETLARPDPKALSLRGIWRNGVLVFSDPRSAWSVALMALVYAGLMAYLLSAPTLYIGYFGLREDGFALVFALVATITLVVQPVNARLLRRYQPVQIMRYAVPAFFVVSVALLVQVALELLTLPGFVVNMMAFFACFSFIMGNGTTMALDPHHERAGIASGLLGFAQLALGTLLGTLIGSFAGAGPVALGLGYTALAVLAYPAFRLAQRSSRLLDEPLT